MSKVKPFVAFHPNVVWYDRLINSISGVDLLKGLLEPGATSHNVDFTQYEQNMFALVKDGSYSRQEDPAIYIYEKESAFGSQLGVWMLTSLEDFTDGTILTHEHTLADHQERLRGYREAVEMETSPVILTYRRSGEICRLMDKAAHRMPELSVEYQQSIHRIWRFSDPQTIAEFEAAFKRIERVYVADGHHRLAAAATMHGTTQQWISSLYVGSGQLICKEFHRMVVPDRHLSGVLLLEELKHYFYISAIPGNVAYRPSKGHRFGMYCEGNWYQLDLKASLEGFERHTDVGILQSLVLEPVFGITDPKTDKQLLNYPADRWEALLSDIATHPGAVVFSLFPMSIDELISQAESQQVLPPKSTYVEPKLPYGLLLFCPKERLLSSSTIDL